MAGTIERDRLQPRKLSQAEVEVAKAAQRLIMESLDRPHARKISITSDDAYGSSIEVPPNVLRIIGHTLGLLARNQRVVLLPEKDELSTVEAANFLNVSRPFVIKEIEAHRLNCRMVGSHRRILFLDLIEYANNMRESRQKALDKMAENANELGLNYFGRLETAHIPHS